MEEKTIKQRQLEILEDTIKYFNISKRNTNEGGKCIYSPTTKSEGCAVGRLITDKELCKKLDTMGGVYRPDVFEKLPNDLKELGEGFLTRLQGLHDVKIYWDEDGLSQSGRDNVYQIKQKFGLC